MSRSAILSGLLGLLLGLAAVPALAEDGAGAMPPPPAVQPPPPAPVVVPAPVATPVYAPVAPCAVPAPQPTAVWCDYPCFQKRDECGWPVDACGERYGQWEVSLEGMFGWLSGPDGWLGELAIGGLAPQFDWEDLDYEAAIGGRLGVRYAMDGQDWIFLKGTWYGTWDDSASSVGVFGFRPGLDRPGDPVASNPVAGTMDSEATAWGIEAAYQGELFCRECLRTDLILGARYFRFEEDSRVDFADAPIGNFTDPAFVLSEATTQFLGLEVGGVAHWDVTPCVELYGLAKVFGGWVRREADVSDQSLFAGGLHSSSDDEDALEWGAELEIGFRWRFVRHFTLTGGYNLFVLDGVQRAYDAMDFSESTSGAVQTRMSEDEIFLHSLFLGVAFDF